MDLFLEYAWLIPVFPLLGFTLITLTPIRRSKTGSGWLAIGLMALATVFAIGLLMAVAQRAPGEGRASVATVESVRSDAAPNAQEGEHGFTFPEPAIVRRFDWVATGRSMFQMGFYIDPIVAVMLAMVTITSTCIHVF